MPDILDKTEATSIDQVTGAVYAVLNRTTTPVDRWMQPGNFHKARTGNDSVLMYASLAAAITAAGSSATTIEIPATTTVSASLTIPKNVTLCFMGTGQISVASGQVLTINSGSQGWPMRQIFTGSGSVKWGHGIGTVYPEWWGAIGDGDSANATVNTAAIQKCLDGFNPTTLVLYSDVSRAGIVELTGGYWIDDTITMHYASQTLRGQGWGTGGATAHRSYLRAAAGLVAKPMVKITDCWGSGIEKLFFIGHGTSKPSCAIEFAENPDGGRPHGLDFSFLSHVYIGDMGGYSPVSGKQFTDGIIFTGLVDGDSNSFRHVSVNGCDNSGIDNTNNPNAADTHWDSLIITNCGSGFKCNSHVVGTNWLFALNDVDLNLSGASAKMQLRHIGSEGSGRLATLTGQGVKLIILGGTWQCGGNFTPADSGNDRWIIDAQVSFTQYVHIEDFEWIGSGSSFKNPVIRIGTSGGSSDSLLRLINTNFGSTNIKVAESGSTLTSYASVEISTRIPSGLSAPIYSRVILDPNRTEDRTFQTSRYDFTGKLGTYGGPFNVKRLAAPTGVTASAAVGSGATTYSYKVVALTHDGKSFPSSAATCTNAASLGVSNKNLVSWLQVIGAYAYEIYGRSSGSEQLLITLPADDMRSGFQWAYDDGTLTPSGALPTVNNTGNAAVEGVLTIGTYTSTERDALTAVNGMLIYNSTTSKLQARAGGAWVDLH